MAITAGLAQSPTQAAIYTLLIGDATLTALSCGTRIYDAVPQATGLDHVAIGEWTESSDDTLESDNAGIGSEMTVTIHAVTSDDDGADGYKNGQAIASRIKVLLHDATLAISGWTCVLCQHEGTVAMRDDGIPGEIRRHLISTYRIVAEAT